MLNTQNYITRGIKVINFGLQRSSGKSSNKSEKLA